MTVESIFEETGIMDHFIHTYSNHGKSKLAENLRNLTRARNLEQYESSKKFILNEIKTLMENKVGELIQSDGIEREHWKDVHPIQCYQKLISYFEEKRTTS